MKAIASTLALCALCAVAGAQDEITATQQAAEDPEHAQLRELREALTQAVLAGDTEAQIALTDEDIVTTWQNNQVARGHEGLRAFLEEMNGGADKVFQGYTVPPTADDLTILHGGDTGIVFGTSVPHYKYMGLEFDLENRWTATLVKEDGTWKLAAYHVSASIVDNPILTAARQSLVWTGALAAILGIVAGVLGCRFLRRRGTPPEQT